MGNRIGDYRDYRDKGEGMVRQFRFALLISAVTAMAVSPAQANFFRSKGGCNSCSTSNACTRTIHTEECVPETYTKQVTKYKVECKTEEYATFRCEKVPVCKERVVCCVKKVPEYRTEIRKVSKTVTTYEDRCVTKNEYKTVQETVMKKKLVSLGHWENYTVTRRNLLGSLCADPCDPCANQSRTVCKKKWVCCPQYECCPTTVCKKVCCPVTVTCKVPVCKTICCDQEVKVCTWKCVNEQRVEKYTCYETRKVACKAVRTVRVCVPHCENVTCTRMVRKPACKEVACAPAANTCSGAAASSCCPAPAASHCCPAPAASHCCPTSSCSNECDPCGRTSRLRGLFHKNNRLCCEPVRCNASTSCCR
ncbi:MAG: hypothetical protein K2X38_23585 [Gemmataceae bacterium]|nr:hypothetical protein [Gemmataceae bacterium]